MDTVTYQTLSVIEFMEAHFIPLRVFYQAQPLAADFNVKSTPTLVTLDSEGKEHHRTEGFLAPEELVSSLLLGLAKSRFDMNELSEALDILERLLADHSQSNAAPEAIYLRGICRYRSTQNQTELKQMYERLQALYPSSEWTRKASPYKLL